MSSCALRFNTIVPVWVELNVRTQCIDNEILNRWARIDAGALHGLWNRLPFRNVFTRFFRGWALAMSFDATSGRSFQGIEICVAISCMLNEIRECRREVPAKTFRFWLLCSFARPGYRSQRTQWLVWSLSQVMASENLTCVVGCTANTLVRARPTQLPLFVRLAKPNMIQ